MKGGPILDKSTSVPDLLQQTSEGFWHANAVQKLGRDGGPHAVEGLLIIETDDPCICKNHSVLQQAKSFLSYVMSMDSIEACWESVCKAHGTDAMRPRTGPASPEYTQDRDWSQIAGSDFMVFDLSWLLETGHFAIL